MNEINKEKNELNNSNDLEDIKHTEMTTIISSKHR
jgi:hypothetical protein